MKKHSKNLFKRLLASSLALAMCASMVCTTAFAEDEYGDYAYVYVAIEVDERGKVETPPSFDAIEGNAEAKQEINELKDKLDAAQETVNRAEEAIPDKEPVFDSTNALENAITEAAKEVTGRLDSLENTPKPEYPADSETNEPAKNGETEGSDPTFAETVNGRVDELNKTQAETDKTVSDAVAEANKTKEELDAAKDRVDEGLKDDQNKLADAKHDAETKVAEAEEAVKNCEDQKTQLETDLKGKIDALNKPSEDAPVRQENQSEADYVEAYNAWVAEHEAYNRQLEGIQAEYDAAAAALKAQSEAAQQAVKDAQDALKKADDDLTALNDAARNEYGNLKEQNDAIEEHNEKLGEYNDNVQKYKEEVNDYNKAAETYNDAVEKYNDAAEKFNESEEVAEYNEAVEKYNKEVDYFKEDLEEYNDAANAYNAKVDAYNKEANEFNEKNTSDTLMKKVLNDLGDKHISVYAEVNAALKADEDKKDEKDDPLSDPDKIKTYNEVIQKYNERVQNQTKEERLAEVNECFAGQKPWTSNDNGNTTYWYSLGKLDITDYYGLVAPDYKVGDVYTWKYEDDKWTGDANLNLPDNRPPLTDSESPAYGLIEDLEKLTKSDFVISPNVKEGYEALVSPSSIDKWVLVVSNGANNGQGGHYVDSSYDTSKNTWHINGYMYVNKLSQLAELEVRAAIVEKDYAVKDEVQNVVLKDETKLNKAEAYVDYKGTDPVNITPPEEKWETRPTHPEDFEGVQLNVTVPSYLDVPSRITPTPAPTPTDPIIPGGGGGSDDDGGDDTTVVNIPDTEVPLTDEPEIEIPDDDVPLTDIPDEDVPLTDIPDEDVPLVDIPDEIVPLADVPKTGDISAMWYAVTLVSACALAALILRRRENG